MKRKIITVIVDDEEPARQRLIELLGQENDIELAGKCANGFEAIESIRETRPDLLLLDVQMPELNGFDVLGRVGLELMPVVVFVTAFDRYAVQAFDVHAFDYLLKPIDDQRFKETLTRAREHILQDRRQELNRKLMDLLAAYERNMLQETHNKSSGRYRQKLAIKERGEIILFDAKDVDYISGAGPYVSIHIGGTSYLLRERMSKLETELDPQIFARIHRSAIVNVERIKKLQPYFNGKYIIFLRDGTRLKLSRNRREIFLERFGLGSRGED
ncbi:response regulator transcription factor [candidate division KSB1 bacterium]|nr:response regulator transcription factor [candidate division KSB1 bacterium]NIV69431.1 response regulator [Phycisphaerae bacterium]NIR70729.1 response regulator transcription factor [candidate division KSB1 bacterium]NIS27786.1 response regulator transcription factor [candidate division KSB1 bacterium]NIT74634.1 response regulator transcription factor [candidate division KSB1 bacterium]